MAFNLIRNKKGKLIRGFAIGKLNDYGNPSRRDSRKFDYDRFEGILMKKSDVKNSEENEYAGIKRQILVDCGYESLNGPKGEKINIEKPVNSLSYSSEDRKYISRICGTFKNQLNALEGRLKRYWNKADSMVLDSYSLEDSSEYKQKEFDF